MKFTDIVPPVVSPVFSLTRHTLYAPDVSFSRYEYIDTAATVCMLPFVLCVVYCRLDHNTFTDTIPEDSPSCTPRVCQFNTENRIKIEIKEANMDSGHCMLFALTRLLLS